VERRFSWLENCWQAITARAGGKFFFLPIFQPSQSTQRRQEAKAQKPVKKPFFFGPFAPLR
jgi:hypothetical protein